MKTASKVILVMLCAVSLVAASVFGTLAYLTSQASVTNTFSVGSVGLTLDELDVDEDSNKADNVTVDGKIRDTANAYQLFPGHTYTKDPTVHIDEDSESCYVFVKVENGLVKITETGKVNIEADTNEKKSDGETDYVTISEQIADNGWTELVGVENVYYKTYTKGDTTKDYVVFADFKISDTVTNDQLALFAPVTTGEGEEAVTESATITVTGYAVQKDGFDTANDAWNATFGAPAAPEAGN